LEAKQVQLNEIANQAFEVADLKIAFLSRSRICPRALPISKGMV
jgi:hypothetical protein